MRLSRYFLPLLKENPKDAEIVSHRLMLRAGMIRQQAAGIYAWLPLGLRVLDKIAAVVREEMNRSGALEILMPTIQPLDLWRESGRDTDYGKEMLRIRDRQDRDLLYGPTNEEMVTEIFRAHIHSYKQLPLNLYHIQWKFRDELRPRFGVMRGREFLMKDAYTFDMTAEGARHSYRQMFLAYLRIFHRLGLRAIPVQADTGPIGGDLSHEFVILAQTGESAVYCHRALLNAPIPGADTDFSADLAPVVNRWTEPYAASDDKHDADAFAKLDAADQVQARGIEVGHIFYFGTKYSGPMRAVARTQAGGEMAVHMGSHGIGVSRLVGAIIEAGHDENGIVWPVHTAPFDCGLINLKMRDTATGSLCAAIEERLANAGLSVLYDDTDERAGAKFAAMDLIGLPIQIIVGPRDAAAGLIEVKRRADGKRSQVSLDTLIEFIRSEQADLTEAAGAANLNLPSPVAAA